MKLTATMRKNALARALKEVQVPEWEYLKAAEAEFVRLYAAWRDEQCSAEELAVLEKWGDASYVRGIGYVAKGDPTTYYASNIRYQGFHLRSTEILLPRRLAHTDEGVPDAIADAGARVKETHSRWENAVWHAESRIRTFFSACRTVEALAKGWPPAAEMFAGDAEVSAPPQPTAPDIREFFPQYAALPPGEGE